MLAHLPAWAQPVSAGILAALPTLSGEDITLRVAHQMMTIDGRPSHAIGVSYERKVGDTARFARLAGEDVGETSFVAGVRFWF